MIQPVTVMGWVDSHRVKHLKKKKASLYSEIATPILGIFFGHLLLAQEFRTPWFLWPVEVKQRIFHIYQTLPGWMMGSCPETGPCREIGERCNLWKLFCNWFKLLSIRLWSIRLAFYEVHQCFKYCQRHGTSYQLLSQNIDLNKIHISREEFTTIGSFAKLSLCWVH